MADAMKHIVANFSKQDKFEGVDFRRWQKKMHFLLSTMSMVYVLNTPMPEDGENATVEHIKKMEQMVIMEYLVNISKRRTFWSFNEDILKITVLTTNTPYPSRKIWRIRACTHQRPRRTQDQYVVSREDQYAVLKI
ncbi:hypothetical protein Tco_0242493 [Tanacetum coccineum]